MLRARLGTFADGCDQAVQYQTGVANEREVNRHIFIDVGWIQRRVDDPFAFGDLDAKGSTREAAADAEYQIGFLDEMLDRFRDAPSAGTQRQAMIFRKALLPAKLVVTGAASSSANSFSEPKAPRSARPAPHK